MKRWIWIQMIIFESRGDMYLDSECGNAFWLAVTDYDVQNGEIVLWNIKMIRIFGQMP